ncbi:MAG: septum site-determining protein MinC [Chloroflexota bacterium]
MSEQLQIKGVNDGLLISLGSLTYAEFLNQLNKTLPEKQAFFQGSRVAIDVGPMKLNGRHIAEISTTLTQYGVELWSILSDHEDTREAARKMDLGTRLGGSQTDLDGKPLQTRHKTQTAVNPSLQEDLIIKETIRSGKSIYADGSIVIIGDVNPGAELIAGGDVIVWGRLRGLVHAGAKGDQAAIICALVLNPTQLRIADKIAIAPDEKQTAVIPEQATITKGQIVAEPWQPKSISKTS